MNQQTNEIFNQINQFTNIEDPAPFDGTNYPFTHIPIYTFTHSFMQNKPNFLDAQMNVNSILTKDYERNDIFAVPENKPNSNPIQTQSNPISKQLQGKMYF